MVDLTQTPDRVVGFARQPPAGRRSRHRRNPMSSLPRYAYAIAIFLGLLAAFAPANLPLESPSFTTALLVSTAIFGVAGLLLGALWPAGGWRWGLWVVAPGLLLVTIGLISSGEFASFFGDDLPFLAAGLVGACVGGAMGDRSRGAAKPTGQDSD